MKESTITRDMKTASALPSNVFFASHSFSSMLIRITESSGTSSGVPRFSRGTPRALDSPIRFLACYYAFIDVVD